MRCASIFARKRMVRGEALPNTGGSIHEKWLNAITIPPSGGTRSFP